MIWRLVQSVTELCRGLHAAQRKHVIVLLAGCRVLELPAELWVEAGELGHRLGRKGVAVKTLDFLIAVHAIFHDVELLTADSDFRQIAKAGVGLRLARPSRAPLLRQRDAEGYDGLVAKRVVTHKFSNRAAKLSAAPAPPPHGEIARGQHEPFTSFKINGVTKNG